MRRSGTVGKNSAVVSSQQKTVTIHTFKRLLSEEAVRILIAMYVLHGHEYVDLAHFIDRHAPGATTGKGGLFPRLRWWDLVEVQHDREGDEVQGTWRVTGAAAPFIKGLSLLAERVDECQGEVVQGPFGKTYKVQRWAGWLYRFEEASTAIRQLASSNQNVLAYFTSQWSNKQRTG